MEYIGIGICVIIVMAICMFIMQRKKNNQVSLSENTKTASVKHVVAVSDDLLTKLVIERLPAEAIEDESKLIEITDSKVLAHINSLVPGLAQAGNAVNNVTQAIQANGEVLYRAVLPAGAKLSNSRTLEGAVKEMYHGANGIKGHADWLPAEVQKGMEITTNTVVAAMGVASMIVGQYYMNQINEELGVISDEDELRSRRH